MPKNLDGADKANAGGVLTKYLFTKPQLRQPVKKR